MAGEPDDTTAAGAPASDATPGGDVDVLGRAAEVLAALGSWLLRLPVVGFGALVAVVAVARSGIGIHTHVALVEAARTFPELGSSSYANAVIGPALAWVTGLRTRPGYIGLHVAATAAWVVLTVGLLKRRAPSPMAWRSAVIWCAVSSTFAVALQGLGLFDVWLLLAGTGLALGEGLALPLAAGALFAAVNPILGAGAIVGHALTRRGLGEERNRIGAPWWRADAAAAAGLVAVGIPLATWLHHQGVASRVSLFGPLFGSSVRWAVGLGSVGVYSWFGVAWVAVAAILVACSGDRRRLLRVALGLVAIPAAFTVTTLDGTRIFATTSWAALLVAVEALARRTADAGSLRDRAFLGGVAAAALLLPAVQTRFAEAGIFLPWFQVVQGLANRL